MAGPPDSFGHGDVLALPINVDHKGKFGVKAFHREQTPDERVQQTLEDLQERHHH